MNNNEYTLSEKDYEIEHLEHVNRDLIDALREIFRNHGENEDISTICNKAFKRSAA